MKALVIYDSEHGNTEKIAKIIAGTLDNFCSAKAVFAADAGAGRLKGADLLVVGSSPIMEKSAVPMKSFLETIPEGHLCNALAACFDVRSLAPHVHTAGPAAEEMEKMLEKTGAMLVARPESFFADDEGGPLHDGEVERAAAWALSLLDLQREREKERERTSNS